MRGRGHGPFRWSPRWRARVAPLATGAPSSRAITVPTCLRNVLNVTQSYFVFLVASFQRGTWWSTRSRCRLGSARLRRSDCVPAPASEGVAVKWPRLGSRQGWSPLSTAARAQAGRDRARERRLQAAQERRLRLDPDQMAREKRIDEATVDVELAREARVECERALESAEFNQDGDLVQFRLLA